MTLETMTKTTPEQEREINGPSRTSGESFLAHPAHARWAATAMLAFVVLIAILVPAGPLELDRSWSEAMRHLETPLLTDLALVFNWLGRGLGRALALALVGLLLLRRRRWLALAAFAVAESLAPHCRHTPRQQHLAARVRHGPAARPSGEKVESAI
jgi:hypothetical protein